MIKAQLNTVSTAVATKVRGTLDACAAPNPAPHGGCVALRDIIR